MQKKMAPIDIHQHSLNVYGDQTVDVSTVRQWVVHFSSGNSNSGAPAGVDFKNSGMQALVCCWRKCIANGDNDVEK